MPRMTTPDRLIGIGGGGSRVVYRFMDQDWILEEVVSDEHDEGDYLKATVIDSATNDSFHADRYDDATDTIDDVIEESSVSSDAGRIQFPEPRIVPEILGDHWRRPDQLTSPPVIRELLESEDMNSWWLDSGRDPLKKIDSTGLGGGVSRRRAVSKALYHVTEYTDNSVRPSRIQAVGQDDDDHVCVVAALGGGTGSGMLLDFAKALDTTQTHLFAILPDPSEQSNERANAYAALSELEYARLNDENRENPFETITLIPYQASLGDRPEAFEMAVVRTILAHQNGMQGENLDGQLPPGSNNGPPDFAPFSVAVPYTILYDIRAKEDAQSDIRDFLDKKEDELERERDLYQVLGDFLSDAFPTIPDELNSGESLDLPDSCGDHAVTLQDRIEDDIRDTLLTQVAFDVAGIGDEAEDIREHMNEVIAEHINFNDTTTDKGRALALANNAERIRNRVKRQSYEASDELAGRLHAIVVDELNNIVSRRNLWAVTEQITAETQANEDEARMLRRLVREVILSPDVQYIDTVLDGYQDMLDDLDDEYNLLTEIREEVVDKRDESVLSSLESRVENWRSDVKMPAQRLEMAHLHQSSVTTAIDKLVDNVEDALLTLEGADTESQTQQASISTDFNDDGDVEVDDIEDLDDLLSEMDVSQINWDAIETEFQSVTEARKHHVAHSGGFLGPNRSEQFDIAVGQTGTYFEIQPGEDVKSVDKPWECAFSSSTLARGDKITTAKQDAKDAIADSAVDARFTEGRTGELISDEVSLSAGMEDIVLPVDLNLSELKRQVRTDLSELLEKPESGLATEIQDIMLTDQLASSDESDLEESRTATMQALYNAYLKPFNDRIEKVDNRLDRLRIDDDDSHGMVSVLTVLKGLANGADEVPADVELPKTRAMDVANETYGDRFAREYEGLYEVEFEREGGSDDEAHPYLQHETADASDLVGDPSHIGESTVVSSEEKDIEEIFRNSLRDLNTDSRVPIKNLDPKASGAVSGTTYEHHRFRSIYLSKGYDNHQDMDSKYSDVRSAIGGIAEWIESNTDGYKAFTCHGGSPDEITMVLFIGGIFLDNIAPAVETNGYQAQYRQRQRESEFVGEHHSIGLGGKWSHWTAMQNEAMGTDDWPDVGVYVHRSETRDVDDPKFIDELLELLQTDTEDPKDLFREMLAFDSYPSSIKRERESAEADD